MSDDIKERLTRTETKIETIEETLKHMAGYLRYMLFTGIGIFAGLVVHLIKELSN